MKISGFVLGLYVLLALGCGGGGGGSGGGDEQPTGAVDITYALGCSVSMGGGIGWIEIPANCGVTGIVGDSFETDQSVIHLSGTSFPPESDNCSNPELTVGGPICIPLFPGSNVQWENLRNGVSGSGSSGYQRIVFMDPVWTTFFARPDYAGWSTRNESYVAGIPLEVGANAIRISVSDSNNSGTSEITVTRVTDVTPPSVHSVDPEPDGIYGFRVVVYFTEQLDLDSAANALQVADSNGQPISGLPVYDSRYLTLIWRPAQALSRGAAYTARLSGVADISGNTMISAYEWSFTVN
jgi:hypothetical protein